MNQSESNKWKDTLSNSQQLGGIETSVLDNGAGRGVRIAWVNTGTGLRYKVVLDRGMDILDAFHNENSLAWISHAGLTAPQPFSSQGIDWLRTFGGGLLTTCGLSNAGPPNSDSNGSRGLHGNYSNLAAEIISIKQPDIFSGDLSFELVGKITESSTFGPSLELVRRISGTIGSAEIHIQDQVTNRGNAKAPHMLLYHINCGWPLIDEGTRVVWQGEPQRRSGESEVRQNSRKDGFRHCPAPMDSHAGFGEEVAFIDPYGDKEQQVVCGYVNDQLGLGLKISFSKIQLPWLIHWQHWGKNEYVTALEPATNPPIGQAAARANQSLLELEPGESRSYDLHFSVLLGEAAREFS